jgi:hypothetical protein
MVFCLEKLKKICKKRKNSLKSQKIDIQPPPADLFSRRLGPVAANSF